MAWITTPTNSRYWTNELIARVEEGHLTWEQIARAALSYMSEDDVEDMARCNELVEDPDEEDEDPDENDEVSNGFDESLRGESMPFT